MQSRVLMWWTEDRTRASRKAVIDTLAKIRLSGVHADGSRLSNSKPDRRATKRPAGRSRKS
jgi:hypothetical protein